MSQRPQDSFSSFWRSQLNVSSQTQLQASSQLPDLSSQDLHGQVLTQETVSQADAWKMNQQNQAVSSQRSDLEQPKFCSQTASRPPAKTTSSEYGLAPMSLEAYLELHSSLTGGNSAGKIQSICNLDERKINRGDLKRVGLSGSRIGRHYWQVIFSHCRCSAYMEHQRVAVTRRE